MIFEHAVDPASPCSGQHALQPRITRLKVHRLWPKTVSITDFFSLTVSVHLSWSNSLTDLYPHFLAHAALRHLTRRHVTPAPWSHIKKKLAYQHHEYQY